MCSDSLSADVYAECIISCVFLVVVRDLTSSAVSEGVRQGAILRAARNHPVCFFSQAVFITV